MKDGITLAGRYNVKDADLDPICVAPEYVYTVITPEPEVLLGICDASLKGGVKEHDVDCPL